MNISLSLRDASVQDIQLELLRRTKFNAFDGERVLRVCCVIGTCGLPSCWIGPEFRTTRHRACC